MFLDPSITIFCSSPGLTLHLILFRLKQTFFQMAFDILSTIGTKLTRKFFIVTSLILKSFEQYLEIFSFHSKILQCLSALSIIKIAPRSARQEYFRIFVIKCYTKLLFVLYSYLFGHLLIFLAHCPVKYLCCFFHLFLYIFICNTITFLGDIIGGFVFSFPFRCLGVVYVILSVVICYGSHSIFSFWTVELFDFSLYFFCFYYIFNFHQQVLNNQIRGSNKKTQTFI